MIKTKKQYFEEVKAHFDKEWTEFQLNLKTRFEGIEFRKIVDLVETILGDSQFQFHYWSLFHEAGILVANTPNDFYIPADSGNMVAEFNRLHENLNWAFCCEEGAYLVKATLQADMPPFIRYFVSTETLYCMGNLGIEKMILRRMGGMNMKVLGAECRMLDIQGYVRLLEAIADKDSYETRKGIVLMKKNIYDGIFDSLPADTAIGF